MGAIHYKFENGQCMLADDCHVTEEDSVEELDCSVRLYNLLRRNGYDRIGRVTAAPGMVFYETEGFSMKVLRELLLRLDFLGFRFSDWSKISPSMTITETMWPLMNAAAQHFSPKLKKNSGLNAAKKPVSTPESAEQG